MNLPVRNCSFTFAADFPTAGKESAGSGIHRTSQLLQFSNRAPFTLQSLWHQCFYAFVCLYLQCVLQGVSHCYVRQFHLCLWNCSLCELQPVLVFSTGARVSCGFLYDYEIMLTFHNDELNCLCHFMIRETGLLADMCTASE